MVRVVAVPDDRVAVAAQRVLHRRAHGVDAGAAALAIPFVPSGVNGDGLSMLPVRSGGTSIACGT